MKSIILLLFFNFLFLASFCQDFTHQKRADSARNQIDADSVSYAIISVNKNEFGYDIFRDNKLLIHQPQIPGVPGNKGFETKAEAEKVAALMVEKIRKGIFPPTVTIDELKNLKIKIE
jgi:hypothetical protein